MARECVSDWPAAANELARAFWPGPLTLVLPRSKKVPDVVTAGGETVGVRWPSHPFIQAVIWECGFPLAAPSANLSNRVSPTNAGHVAKDLGDKNPGVIVDGGQSQVGIESTVLDLTTNPPRVLRPGMIHEASLQSGASGGRWSGWETKLIAVGIQKTNMRLMRCEVRECCPGIIRRRQPWGCGRGATRKTLERQIADRKWRIEQVHVIAHTKIPVSGVFGSVSVIPHDAEAFARAIYAELHQCDEAGARWIIMEALPETNECGRPSRTV